MSRVDRMEQEVDQTGMKYTQGLVAARLRDSWNAGLWVMGCVCVFQDATLVKA